MLDDDLDCLIRVEAVDNGCGIPWKRWTLRLSMSPTGDALTLSEMSPVRRPGEIHGEDPCFPLNLKQFNNLYQPHLHRGQSSTYVRIFECM